MPPIPLRDRSPLLKQVVLDFFGQYAQLLVQGRMRALTQPLCFVLSPWFESGAKDEESNPQLQQRAVEMGNLGIDGARYVARFKEVLASDPHLMQCCGFESALARHIDQYLAPSLSINLMAARYRDQVEKDWSDFVKLTYSDSLSRLSYTHLFNFKSEESVIDLGEGRIERLSRDQIADLLGESTRAVDFFYRPDESECFLVFEESGWCKNAKEWITATQEKASEIVFLLQLYKNLLVHGTYTIPVLSPPWVSSLWSRLISPTYLGTFRGTRYKNGRAPYTLTAEELPALRRWIAFYNSPECRTKLSSAPNGLGQMILRSAEYFRSSQFREKAPERLVDLAIALESMFTPSSAKTELTYRIAQNLSQLLGVTPEERIEINRHAKRLYEKRSALLHGQYDYTKFARGEFVSDDDNEGWTNLIRTAIIRLIVLYFRGASDREKLLGELGSAALDHRIGDKLRSESDPDLFLSEFAG